MAVFSGSTKNKLSDEYMLSAVRDEQRLSYLSVIVHDLKNPAIAQKRALEFMLGGEFGELKPKQREILEIILESSNYMNNMIASIMDTYIFNDGSISLEYHKISLLNLVVECLNEVEYLAQDKNIQFLLCEISDSYDVKCDRVQIKRVIMNLLSNQIKYAYKNTCVHIGLEIKNNYIYLSFTNNSPCITPDKISHIFEKYITYAQMYNLPGIGLGLYASKQIIEAHDGKIYAESFPDNRNRFCFCLPLKYVHMRKCRVVTF